MKVIVFDKNSVKAAFGNGAIVVADEGYVVVVITRLGDTYEVLTAQDGEKFFKAVAMYNQVADVGLKNPTKVRKS